MRAILVSFVCSFSLTTFAQNQGINGNRILPEIEAINQQAEECFEKAESNLAMKVCAGQKFSAADALLNKTYKQIIAQLDAVIAQENAENLSGTERYGQETKDRLIKAQRAWINFRDANCVYEGASMLYGTGEPLVISSCLGRMTIERIVELIDMSEPYM